MASYIFFGASGGPLDFFVSLDDGLGLFRLLASVRSAPNVSIISVDVRNGATASAFGRIESPIQNASFQLMVHCLFAGAGGAPLFLRVMDGKKALACRDSLGNLLTPASQGILLATLQAGQFLGEDFRVTP